MFKIWDGNESGKLEVNELTLPLIVLGISNDSSFIKRLLRVLHDEKVTSKYNSDEISQPSTTESPLLNKKGS